MDPGRDIELIRNRYINSCHHLDSQYGRVLKYLEEHGLLDSTIVILTETMGGIHGKWSLGTQFELVEQTRTPLVLLGCRVWIRARWIP